MSLSQHECLHLALRQGVNGGGVMRSFVARGLPQGSLIPCLVHNAVMTVSVEVGAVN